MYNCSVLDRTGKTPNKRNDVGVFTSERKEVLDKPQFQETEKKPPELLNLDIVSKRKNYSFSFLKLHLLVLPPVSRYQRQTPIACQT